MIPAVNYLLEVKEQYEDYPYPPRDPQNEKRELLLPHMDMPERLNHYCFGGRQTFGKGFRMLVAGGGTGDTSIYLAEQYAPLEAEIVHLDLSAASIAVAKERARQRGIEKRITFVHASLLDLPTLNLGQFNYINCIGVLHHLADPQKGLAALTSVLAPDGAMAIMVYGQYGRHAIYPMQETFRLLLKNVPNKADKITYARDVFTQLPHSNWYQFSKNCFSADFAHDNSFYDLLLHPQDRAYTIPELYDFIASVRLHGFSLQHELASGKHIYDPDRILTQKHLQDQTAKLSIQERELLAELLNGDFTTHFFYTAFRDLQEPDVNDENFVPVVSYDKQSIVKALTKLAVTSREKSITYHNPYGNLVIHLNLFPTTSALMFAIDGKRSTAEIIESISSRKEYKHEQIKENFLKLYEDLRRHDLVFLRHRDIPAFDNPDMLQEKMQKRMGY